MDKVENTKDEAILLKEAQQNGTMDNPELDPPDVAEVNNNDETVR